jgi:dephospho-CoA kinase
VPILGITGGVATGKSTFRNLLLARLDADFFDADACARELLDSDVVIKQQVRESFSPQAYDEQGHPNRSLIRELIYRDTAKRRTLEAILHPVIRSRWTRHASDARQRDRIFVVDIPLLFETRAESLFDHVVVVACSEADQLRRMTDIRQLPLDLARSMLASQWPMAVKIRLATHVAWNGGSLDRLETQAELFARYLHRIYD